MKREGNPGTTQRRTTVDPEFVVQWFRRAGTGTVPPQTPKTPLGTARAKNRAVVFPWSFSFVLIFFSLCYPFPSYGPCRVSSPIPTWASVVSGYLAGSRLIALRVAS